MSAAGGSSNSQPSASVKPANSFISHERVDYRLAIRNLIAASGLVDKQGFVTLAPTHLEIYRAAATRPERPIISPTVAPPWNARHNGGMVSLLVRCAGAIEKGLGETWNELASKRECSPPAPWGTTEVVRVRAKALEELAPDVGAYEKVGVRRRADKFVAGRERWKLVVSAVNLTRERLEMEALEDAAAPTRLVTRRASNTGLYVCVARTEVLFPGSARAGKDAKDLWTCESIGPAIPGDIGEALDRVSQLVRHNLRGCGVVKMRAGPKMADRYTTILPRALLLSGTRKQDGNDEVVKKLAEALQRVDKDAGPAGRQDARGFVTVAYLWRNQREKVWPGIVAWELEALWQWRDSFDDETKLGGLSRKDWMIDYKAKVSAAKGKAPLYRLDDHEVWARNWRGARRLK